MICAATYDSLDQIPEAFRDEFENVNGKYRIKEDAIPGAAEVLNPGLAANRDRALSQLKTATEVTIPALRTELSQAQSNQSDAIPPGGKVLSAEDAKLFDRYAKLGTPKDLETKLNRIPELEELAQSVELEKSTKDLGETGINTAVLVDWAKGRTDISFTTKDVVENGKTVKVAYVKVDEKDGDKIKVSEKPLLEYAKEAMPDWMFSALTTVNGKQNPGPQSQQPTGVRLPNIGGGSATKDVDKSKGGTRPVDKFNEQRAAAPDPFAPASK